MRRPLRLALFSILCGIISTWLTAWMAIAHFNSTTQRLEYRRDNATPPQWLMSMSSTPLTTVVWSKPIDSSDSSLMSSLDLGGKIFVPSVPPSWSRPGRVPIYDMLSNQIAPAYRPWQLLEIAAGWPLPCLRGAWTESPGTDVFMVYFSTTRPSFALVPFQTQTITRGLPIPARFAGASPILPTVPIWPGLLANIAIHAAVFACLFFGCGALLTQLRRRLAQSRCLCPTCRYDRSGLAADANCPECGTPTSRAHKPA